MSDSPTTFRAEPDDGGFDWDDAAELHRRDDAGVLARFQAVRRGKLVELIRFFMTLEADERENYVIAKAGDRRLAPAEIEALYNSPDFPSASG
jgi:hypothetical protein